MSWIQKKSPRPSSSPQRLVSSGSVERQVGVAVQLQCDKDGLKNPMDWGSVPLALKEKFPHWKKSTPEIKSESKNSLKAETDRSIHFSGSFKAPDYTIPYMVMEKDTLNSIAIKFETTPSDIARINRKHQGPSFYIFPGDVIHVPDIENMPKPPSPHPKSPPTTPTTGEGGGAGESSVGGGAGENVRGRQQTPLNWSTDVAEEVADTHLSIVCKFMSEDQGCIHGSLVVNHQTVMFTPHPTDPLVQELGKLCFEIVLPVCDITYAALTKDVTPPTRRNQTKNSDGSSSHDNSEGRVTSESSMELTLSLDKVEVHDDDTKIPVIKFTKASLDKGEGAGDVGEGGDVSESGDVSEGGDVGEAGVDSTGLDGKDASESCDPGDIALADNGGDGTDNSLAEASETTPHETSEEGDFPSIKTLQGDGSTEDPTKSSKNMLSVESSQSVPASNSCESCEHLMSNEPVFLHVHVRPKPGTTYTYTPINNSVGINIPKKNKGARLSSSPAIQQVKTCFCFAFPEKRANDLVQFICTHHPEPLTRENRPLRSWIEGTFEFISCEEEHSSGGLDFCEDHFDSSSWEIFSLQDLHMYRRRLSVMEVMDLPPPTLSEESQLLEVDHLKKLVVILPASAVSHDWVLIYSTFRDGISLRTMYRNMVAFKNEDSPVVLVVRDDKNKIFGSVTTCPLRMSEKFYGRGESSLYSFESPTEMLHYYWTGQNHYFVKGNSNSLSIGSGDGHPGLWIDENFYHGSSYECSTFNNKCLASSQDFICTGVEAWGFL